MSSHKLIKTSDPLASIKNLIIVPEIIPNQDEIIVNNVPEIPEATTEDIFGKDMNQKVGIKKDKMVIDMVIDNELPQKSKIGKRGKDKKKRAKKVMTESQLAALAKGRAKSLATRSARKLAKQKAIESVTNPVPVLAKPTPHKQLDYDTFSNYMNMYEDSKKKKYNTSSEPHPNKVINERLRPLPPRSKPRIQQRRAPTPAPVRKKAVLKWNGNITNWQTTQPSKNSRWNFGL